MERIMKRIKQWMVALGLVLLSSPLSAQTTVEYIHTDALGSIVAISDEAGNVIERREYEPFGTQLTPVLEDGPGYTGHVQDATTGLVYAQQRYYDPQIGRFVSVDPVTVDGNTGANFNRYKYAGNNPYRFVDPDGRQEYEKVTGSHIAGAGGFAGSRVYGTPGGVGGMAATPAMPRPLPLPMPTPNVGKALADGVMPLIDKMATEVRGITEKAQGPEGVQYSLRARWDRDYPNLNTGGKTALKAGEVWKYGQTTRPDRYSQQWLDKMGLRFVPEYRGGQMQIKMMEKYKIYGYRLEHGLERPPGNPIDR